ncbi:DUF3306 domain-containing protein [Polaromonas naphthalenivorans]|uniref:DUF3306 domain-containing protein n=1 Tax=Polaromonas naphthalenivorans (strain CJ2) TaxID=365044 RepID=A1VKH0_POLNA|nr:DUF3306 domain-containing protein [Polaromonas naphthalenivorans]ABM36148.1 conserved hypothetical protein [Polaromonas naphthalenivorans CJ2]
MADERPGFLGRWARRKTDALQGRPLDDEPAVPASTVPVAGVPVNAAPAGAPSPGMPAAEPPEKLLSLDDVKLLTRDSDFKPFMARNVAGDVRNAAMKKLFTDPHYNVMDGLDTYIDDYSRPDPIPQAMLRRMVGAKLLKIFDEEEQEAAKGQRSALTQGDAASGPADNPNKPMPETVAQSGDSPETSSPQRVSSEHPSQPEPADSSGASQHDDHAHPHLQLQPDHAPPAPSAGRGIG